MRLPHGINNTNERIILRAEAIYRGVDWGTEPDETDINSNEDSEIAKAKAIADVWLERV